jgi:hypothetical protein
MADPTTATGDEFGDFEEADDVWVDSAADADDAGDARVGADATDVVLVETAGHELPLSHTHTEQAPQPASTDTSTIDAFHTTSVSAARYEEIVREELGPVRDSGGFSSSFVELEGRYPEFLAPPHLR